MKKFLSLIVTMIFVLCLGACRSNKDVISNIDTNASVPKTKTESTVADDTKDESDMSDNSSSKKDETKNATSSNATASNPSTNSKDNTTNSKPSASKPSSNTTEKPSTSQPDSQNNSSITYTVTYDANGGWGTTNDSVHKSNEERSLTKNGYKRAGYAFLGWAENSAAKTPKYSDVQQVKNLTLTNNSVVKLYAVWEISQTSRFDECKRAITGRKEVNYHTTAIDNFGVTHSEVAVFMNRDTYPVEKRYDERYTNGLFSKIKGTLYLGGEYTINSHTNIQLIIKADGVIVYKSRFLTKYSNSESFEVNIAGANVIEIYVADPESKTIEAWNRGGDIIIKNLILER